MARTPRKHPLDKNPYADKNVDSKLDSILAFAKVGLMLVGLVGISMELFRDNGLLKQGFNKLLDSSLGIFSFLILFAVLYVLNRWFSTRDDGTAKRRADLPMYIMMAIGAYFLFRLITTGSMAA